MGRLLWFIAGIFALVAACAGASMLGARAGRPLPVVPPSPVVVPPPKPVPASKRARRNALREFAREDGGRSIQVKYGFVDYAGEEHVVSCTVAKADVETERASYGYVREELRTALNQYVSGEMESEAARRGLRDHVQITTSDWGGYTLEVSWTSAQMEADLDAYRDWVRAEIPARRTAYLAKLYRDRGFLLKKNRITIDYNSIARRATPHVDDCLKALLRAAPGYPTRDVIGLLLAFYQELKYEIPPDTDGSKHTVGLWVPAEVLANGKGDCDSKATAFAAMWRELEPRVIVILVPHHALVGVEAKPGPNESYVRVGNRYFVLCEVAGPGKLRPGYHPIQGDFEYVMIDPV